MKIHLLMVQDAEGVRLPLAAYGDELAALDARQSKMSSVDVIEALELLGARYVVMPIEYHSKPLDTISTHSPVIGGQSTVD